MKPFQVGKCLLLFKDVMKRVRKEWEVVCTREDPLHKREGSPGNKKAPNLREGQCPRILGWMW